MTPFTRALGTLTAAATLALAACGGPSEPSTPAPDAPAARTPSQPAATPPTPTPEPAPAAPDARLASLPAPYNEASFAGGQRQYAKCRACHVIGGDRHSVGPNLTGLFARTVGSAPGYAYSDALQAADFVWSPAELDQWLANPRDFLPGNKMTFAGVRDETQRRDLIAYLLIETAVADGGE